jgi:hypothetical protein
MLSNLIFFRTESASHNDLTSRAIPLHSRTSQGHDKTYRDAADEEEQQLFAVDHEDFSIKNDNSSGHL